jgi:hypothetical protein
MLPKYLKPYAKVVAAAGGIGLMVWTRNAGILIPGLDFLVQDLIIGCLTSLGVYQFRNAPLPTKPGVKK